MLAEWLVNCLILLESLDITDSQYFALKESLESEDNRWRLAFEEHLTPTEALLEWLEETE